MKSKLLIVDDDEEIRTQMKWALNREYEVFLAEDRPRALEAFRSAQPLVTMLDLGLPPYPNDPTEGLAALSEMLAVDPAAKVIIVSGQGEKENALRAVGAGAYDFLCKPVELESLKFQLARCFYVAELEREHRELQRTLGSADAFEGMLGKSPVMQEVFGLIRKVAPSNAPVLLLGESGTGKEMAALSIHRRSARKEGPFVPINCNAIAENLLESELFGHEKGAFTGADRERAGFIETASGGTLFLDEIGELPLPVQVKLLRFLQEQTFQRVGGRQTLQGDVRMVTATNADLKQRISRGEFREDLYFRLAVVAVHLPPLRAREEDVALLAQAFLKRYAALNGKTDLSFSPDALRVFTRYPWPGNVRELQNRVQRAVIMSDDNRIGLEDLELAEASIKMPCMTLKEAREHAEREVVQATLKRNAGKITTTALDLGISRPTLYELMEKLGIARE